MLHNILYNKSKTSANETKFKYSRKKNYSKRQKPKQSTDMTMFKQITYNHVFLSKWNEPKRFITIITNNKVLCSALYYQ